MELQELINAVRHINLVPWSLVARDGLDVSAAQRVVLELKRDGRTRGFVLILKNRHTLGSADAALLQYSLNDPGGLEEAEAAMATGRTNYLCPGDTAVISIPGWVDSVTLDLRGANADAPNEQAETFAFYEVRTLEPAAFTEGC